MSKEADDEDATVTEELEFPTHQELEEGDSHIGIACEPMVQLEKNKPQFCFLLYLPDLTTFLPSAQWSQRG